MTPLEITVVGHGRSTYAPERCTVSLTVRTDGVSAESAAEPAQQCVRELTGLIDPLYNSEFGPINWWSLDQVRHSRHRPHSGFGDQLPYVYQAAAALQVTFSQLDVIDAFVYAASLLEGVDIGHFDWALTTANQTVQTAHVRELAVRDATSKAEAFAAGLGRTRVDAVAIADPGMLSGYAGPATDFSAGQVYSATSSGSDAVALRPQNITIEATVHARFSGA